MAKRHNVELEQMREDGSRGPTLHFHKFYRKESEAMEARDNLQIKGKHAVIVYGNNAETGGNIMGWSVYYR